MLFNIFLHPSRSPASSCHSGTSSSLSHGFTRRASLRSTASSATTAAASNVNSSVSLSLSPLARQSPAGLWCGGARPDPLYCVGSSRCPLVLRLDRRPVCTATGGVGFGGGGATGSGRRCRCGSRRSTRSGGRCGCCCCCHTVQWSHAVPGTSRHTHPAAFGGSHTPFQLPTCPWYVQPDALCPCCCPRCSRCPTYRSAVPAGLTAPLLLPVAACGTNTLASTDRVVVSLLSLSKA